jgi:hypothetical protein
MAVVVVAASHDFAEEGLAAMLPSEHVFVGSLLQLPTTDSDRVSSITDHSITKTNLFGGIVSF